MPKNASSRDPTASSRSAIRRRRSIEFASTSSSNPFPTNRAQVGNHFSRRNRHTQERQEVLSGLVESSRSRASALEQLATVGVNETQLRATEARIARHHGEALAIQAEAYNLQFGAGVSGDGHLRTSDSRPWEEAIPAESETARSSRRTQPSVQLQRRIERLPELSRDLPSLSDPAGSGMLEQTHELRDQIQRLRETLQRHRVEDAIARPSAAPWLEPDRQLHSNDASNPLSALHENRPQLSGLRALLHEVERDFRDPTPRDVGAEFGLSVRARYADNPTENPDRDAPHGGWSDDRISESWNAEHTRRLDVNEDTPIGVVANQVLSHRGYHAENHRRDSLSPSSSETSESSGRPVSASLSSPLRPGPLRFYLDSVSALQHVTTGPIHAPPNGPTNRPGWNNRLPRPPGAPMDRYGRPGDGSRVGQSPPGASMDRYGRHEGGSRFASSRVGQSPPSYISAGGIDGLGDRELSLGPEDDEEEEAWEVMQTTVAPDHTLPSADSSFTSAAASASFSASRSHSAQSSAPTSFRGEDECLLGVDMFASN